jgi:hypothetical protein
MANNFFNAVRRNISSDSTLPTEVYKVPDTKKAILIELDVSNKSTAGVTVTVQLEDESLNETASLTGTVASSNAHSVVTSTGVSGLFTTTSSAAHNLIVNDRITFPSGTLSSFTNSALPPSADITLSGTRIYYVQSIPSTSTFTIAESKSAVSQLTFDVAGSSIQFSKVHLADVVKDAPVPVGGSLKVISGQKLVLESQHANVNDKILIYSSSTNSCDVIASVLQEVS